MIPLLLVILVAFLLTGYASGMPQSIQIVCFVLEAVAVLLLVLPVGRVLGPVW